MGEILRGKYEIAFFTYDKFLGISAAAPYILNQKQIALIDRTLPVHLAGDYLRP